MRTSLPASLAVSCLTVAELTLGVFRASSRDQQHRRMRTLVDAQRLPPLRVDHEVAQVWADMRETLLESKRKLRAHDSWIAATAVAYGLPLVTQDKDFENVFGLELIRV